MAQHPPTRATGTSVLLAALTLVPAFANQVYEASNPEDPTEASADAARCVRSTELDLFDRPESKGHVRATLEVGTRVAVVALDGEWSRVAARANGAVTTGWVESRGLANCSAPTTAFHPFGRPACTGSESLSLLERQGYDLCHDAEVKIARWVGYCYAPGGVNPPRSGRFFSDGDLSKGQRAEPDDYKGLYRKDLLGFDRGHQAPDATIKVRGEDAQRETYALSNITPQYSLLNQGLWQKLEGAVRRWATVEDPVCVVTGPIFRDEVNAQRVGPNGVAVPDAYFAIILQGEAPDVLAFEVPNQPVRHDWLDAGMFLTSVDELESKTGFDFLADLPPEIGNEVEAFVAAEPWSLDVEL